MKNPDSSQPEIEITPEMIEAGTVAYLRRASHDEFSHYTPEEIVEAVLTSALQGSTPPVRRPEGTVGPEHQIVSRRTQ